MKKIKKLMSSLLAMLLVLIVSFSLNRGGGSPKKAEAAGSFIDIQLGVYDEAGINQFIGLKDKQYWYADILNYVNSLATTCVDLGYANLVGVNSAINFRKKQSLSISEINSIESYLIQTVGSSYWTDKTLGLTSSKDSTKSLKDTWGNIEDLVVSDIKWTLANQILGTISEITESGRLFETPKQLTKVSPGNNFYIAVVGTSKRDDGLNTTRVIVDLREWLKLCGNSDGTVSASAIGYVGSKSYGLGASDKEQTLKNGTIRVGWTDTTANHVFENLLIGTIELTVPQSLTSGTCSVDIGKTPETTANYLNSGITTGNIVNSPSYFGITPTTITIGGSQSETTDMSAPKVSSSSLSQTTLISSDNFKNSTLPSGTTLGKNDENVNLILSPEDNATISEVRYSYSSTSSAETGTIVSASSTNNYKIPTPLSSVSYGGSVYIAVKVQAQAGSAYTDWKYITLTRANASSTTNLKNVTVGGKNATLGSDFYSASNLGENTTSTTVGFTPDDGASITSNQVYLFNSLSDAKSAGNNKSYSSGTAISYNSNSNNCTVSGLSAGDVKYLLVPITAENGTEGYKIIQISVDKSSDASITNIVYNGTTYDFTNGTPTINVSSTLSQVSFSVNFVGSSVKIGSSTQSSSNGNVSFNNLNLNTSGDTTFTITPVAANGSNGTAVNVIFHKLSNESKPTIKVETFKSGSSNANTSETISSWTNSLTATISNIPYQSKEYKISISSLPTGATLVSNSAASNQSFTDVTTSTSATVTIVIRSEDGDNHTYTVTLNRTAASSDSSISGVTIANKTASISTDSNIDYTGTTGSYSDTSTTFKFTPPTNGSVVGVYQYASADAAKNSQKTGTSITPNINGLYTIGNLTPGSKNYLAVHVKAENGEESIKVIEIVVPKNSNSSITKVNGDIPSSNTVTINYNEGEEITFTVEFLGSKVVLDETKAEITSSGSTFTINPGSYSNQITLIPYADDGTAGTAITVKFNALSSITIPTVTFRDFNNSQPDVTIGVDDWVSNEYTIHVPFGTTSFSFVLSTLSASGTADKYKVGQDSEATLTKNRKNGSFEIPVVPVSENTLDVILKVKAESGASLTYTIHIVRAAASNVTLPNIPVGASQEPNPPADGTNYSKVVHIKMPSISATSATSNLEDISADENSKLVSQNTNSYKSLDDAIKNVGALTSYTISNGKISNITLADPGESVYIPVSFVAQDGSTQTLVVYEIPRAQSDSAYLNNIEFTTSDGTTAKIDPVFNQNTKSYDLILPTGTSSVNVKALFDNGMSGELTPNNGLAQVINSNIEVSNVGVTGKITVKITPQSGDASKAVTYTFTPIFKSNDVSLNGVKVNTYDVNSTKVGSDLVATFDKDYTYTIIVPYAIKKFDFTVITSDSNAQVKYDGHELTGATGTITIKNAANATDAVSQTEQFVITAADGNTSKTYQLVVERGAAESINTLNNVDLAVDVKDEKGSYSNITGRFADNSAIWTASSKLPFTSQSFRVRFKVSSLLSTVKVNGTTVSFDQYGNITGADLVFTGTAEKEFIYYVEIISESNETRTYEFHVTREAANDNKDYTLNFEYVDINGAPVSSTTAPSTNNPLPFSTKSITWKITASSQTTTITIKSITATGLSSAISSGNSTNISGQDQVLSLTSKSSPTNYIIYTIKVTIKSQDDTTIDENINIYVLAPNKANELNKWDLISQATGGIKEPTSSTASVKNYDLTSNETFKLDLEVNNDPNGLTKIYYSKSPITAKDPSDYEKQCLVYDKDDYFNPGDTIYVYLVPENGDVKSYTFVTNTTIPKQSNADIENVVITEVNDKPNSIGNLKNFKWDANSTDLGTFTVPSNLALIHINVTPAQNSDKASINTKLEVKQINTDYSIQLNDGENVIRFQLIAQNGDYGKEYTLKINRPLPETNDELTSLNINGTNVPFNNNGKYDSVIDVLVPRNSSTVSINSISVIDGTNVHAKYEILDGTTILGSGIGTNNGTIRVNNITAGVVKTLKINVYSEFVQNNGGSCNTYTLNLYPAYTDFDIKNIELLDINGNVILDENGQAFDFNNGSFNSPFVVNFSTKYAQLVVTQVNNNAQVKINNKVQIDCIISNLVEGVSKPSNKFTVVVESEYKKLLNATNENNRDADNQIQTYDIQIDRNSGSSDATLKSIKVVNNGTELSFDDAFVPSDPLKINYSISSPSVSSNSVIVTVEPTDPKAKLNGWIANGDGTYSKTFTIPNTFGSTGGNDEVKIEVFSEVEMSNANPQALTYSITISSKKVELDKEHTITQINAYYANDVQTKYLLGTVDNSPEKVFTSNSGTIYNFEVPASVEYIDLAVIYPEKSSLLINRTAAGANGNYSGTIKLTDDTTTISIVCTAESGLASDQDTYTIVINKKSQDTDTSLDAWYATDPSATNPDNPILDLLVAATSGQKLYLDNSYAGKSLNIIGRVSAPKTINATRQTSIADSYTFNSGSNILTITVKSETQGVEKTYTVDVVVNASLDLDSISITDNQGNSLFNNYDSTAGVFTPINDPVSYVNENYGVKKSAIYVANDITKVNFLATLKDRNAVFAINSMVNDILASDNLGLGSLTTPALTLTIIAQDQSGTNRSYVIDIYRIPGKTGKNIESFIEEGQTSPSTTFNPNTLTYSYRVDNSISSFEAYKTWTLSDGATYKLYDSKGGNNMVLSTGKNVFTVEVFSENEPNTNPNVYTMTVWKANNDFEITNIEFLESQTGSSIKQDASKPQYTFNPETLTYDIYVPYSVDKAYLNVILSDSFGAGWTLNGNTSSNGFQVLNPGDNNFTITGISQYGLLNPTDTETIKSKTYKIVIHRNEASTDSTLKDLQAIVYDSVKGQYYDFITNEYLDGRNPGDLPNPLNIINKTYTVSKVDDKISDKNVSEIMIYATPNDPNARIISGTGRYSFLNTSIEGQVAWIYTIVVEAENGDQTTYTVTLSKEVANPDKDNTISNISVVAKGKEYIASFNPQTKKYTITIPYGPDSYTLSATTALGSSAKLYIGETSNPQTERSSITKTLSLADGGTSVNYYIQAEAVDSTVGRGTEYEVEINFEKADSDSSIKEIKVDGSLVANFNSENLTYNISLPYDKDSLNISAIPSSAKSTIDASGLGDIKLVPGQTKQHTITCRAEDGSTTTYILNIYRDSENPYFSDLSVPGYDLLDKTTLKPTEYDKTAPGYDASGAPIEIEYHVIVPNSQAIGSISIDVPDAKYVTTISQTGESITAGISRTFNNLAFNIAADGSQADTEFIINGTSPAGKTVRYKVIVTRLGVKSADTSFSISKIDAFDKVNGEGSKITDVATDSFKNDFSIGRVNYEYTVPNKVKSLDFAFAPSQPNATVAVYGANNLVSGSTNDVVVVVTAEDGMTTKAYVIKVTREPMQYEVVESNNGEDYVLSKGTETESITSYNLKLKANDLKKIADREAFFKRYISYDKNTNAIDIEILSDINVPILNSVTMKITDGTDEKYIHIDIENDLNYSVVDSANGDNYVLSNPRDNGIIKSYTLKLNSNGLKDVTDKEAFFKNYITTEDQNVTVEVVSDLAENDLTSVTLRISDGVEEEFVVINVNVASGIFDTIGGYFFLGGIVICALILLAILIAVHKDKYGKVADKRKKA